MKMNRLAKCVIVCAVLFGIVFLPQGANAQNTMKLMEEYTSDSVFSGNSFSFNKGTLIIKNDDFWEYGSYFDSYKKGTIVNEMVLDEGVTKLDEGDSWIYSNIKRLELSSTVKSIHINEFFSASSLEEIIVDSDNSYFDSRENCNAVVDSQKNSIVIGCKNTTIPEDVIGIEGYAFAYVELGDFSLPRNISEVSANAFTCAKFTSLTVEEGNETYDCREACNAIIETKTNALIHGFEDSVIPNSIEKIGNTAFSGCKIKSIVLPENLVEIGWEAFYESDLESIEIPNRVTKIGQFAFDGCYKLKSIKLPDALEVIDDNVLAWCSSLGSVTIPGNVTSIGKYAFAGCVFEKVVIPDSVKEIKCEAFLCCERLKYIEIPSSVTFIDDKNFTDYGGHYPDEFTIYGESGSYAQRYALEHYIPFVVLQKETNGIQSIDKETENNASVSDYTNDSRVVITSDNNAVVQETVEQNESVSNDKTANKPKKGAILSSGKAKYKVTKSGKSGGTVAFIRTTSKKVTTVSVPATIKVDGIAYKVTSISASALAKNTKLKSVTIGKNVKTIGKKAFYGCKNLKKITIKSSSLKAVGKNAFKGIYAKAKIKVPKKELSAYKKILTGKGLWKKVKFII